MSTPLDHDSVTAVKPSFVEPEGLGLCPFDFEHLVVEYRRAFLCSSGCLLPQTWLRRLLTKAIRAADEMAWAAEYRAERERVKVKGAKPPSRRVITAEEIETALHGRQRRGWVQAVREFGEESARLDGSDSAFDYLAQLGHIYPSEKRDVGASREVLTYYPEFIRRARSCPAADVDVLLRAAKLVFHTNLGSMRADLATKPIIKRTPVK